jgi:hypothetical protein
MQALLLNGSAIDWILGLMAAEAILISLYHRATGRGIAFPDLVFNLLAGACLLLALRGGRAELTAGWTSLFLAAAFLAHLADLSRRWK